MATQRYFRDPSLQDTVSYDEGPYVKVSIVLNSSSIDTSQYDQYRQGVEITQQKHFDLGLVKIHAGDPGHVFKQNVVGFAQLRRENGRAFGDNNRMDPVAFIEAQSINSSESETFEHIVDGVESVHNITYDGVLEPLAVRVPVTFNNVDMQRISHQVRGCVMAGGVEVNGAANAVDSVIKVDKQALSPYLESYVGTLMPTQINASASMGSSITAYKHTYVAAAPYTDIRYNRNAVTASAYSSDIAAAMSLMTGSTDGYIKMVYGERAATAGWTYDRNVNVGTDSLAFGGMTY